MAEIDRETYELYRKIPLFSGLSETNLQRLFSLTKEIKINSGDYIIHEGEGTDEFFIILEGALEVVKYDKSHKNLHTISTLHKGATIGEMAWLNNAPRSASVRAMTQARLLSTSLQDIQALADKEPGFYCVFKQITKELSQRLHITDEFAVRSLERELQANKLQVSLGHFMLNVIVVLCLFSILLKVMIAAIQVLPDTTYLSVAFLCVMLIFLYLIKKSSGLPLDIFGVTTQNWQIAVYEAIVFTLPIMLLITILKWVIIHIFPSYGGPTFFEPYRLLTLHTDQFRQWVISLLLYCFISVPFQELLARGGLQGPLTFFLTGKHKNIYAIVISNLIFSTMHLYLSAHIALLVFLPGLYLGWLFGRHRTLIGVLVAHILLGGYALFILGF